MLPRQSMGETDRKCLNAFDMGHADAREEVLAFARKKWS
jgi:hypothetical protein